MNAKKKKKKFFTSGSTVFCKDLKRNKQTIGIDVVKLVQCIGNKRTALLACKPTNVKESLGKGIKEKNSALQCNSLMFAITSVFREQEKT